MENKVKKILSKLLRICSCKVKVNKYLSIYLKDDKLFLDFVSKINTEFNTNYTLDYAKTNWITILNVIKDVSK